MALIQEYNKLFEQNSNIKKIYVNNSVVWPSVLTPPDPKLEPFYVENTSTSASYVNISKSNAQAPTLTIEYSTDKINWNTLGQTSTTALSYLLQPGDKVYFRSDCVTWTNGNYYNHFNYVRKIGGNVMSLLYGSNFTGQETSFPMGSTYSLSRVFYNNTYLADISELILPATTLTDYCYYYMFCRCTGMINASDLILPATTLTPNCYQSMFENCNSLQNSPELPATTLADYCYDSMFYSTLLVNAPELLADTLVPYCYRYMFGNCNRLNTVKCLATDISATNCTTSWISGLSTGTFTKKSGVTWPTGSSGIPSSWTVVEV